MIAVRRRTPPAMILVMLAVGLAACWSAGTPVGILAPLGALFFYARGYWLLSLWGGLLIALAGTVLAAMLYPGAIRDAALSLAALVAVAGCIGLLLGPDPLRQSSRLAALRRQAVGQPDGLAGDADSALKGTVHPDDRPAIAHAAASTHSGRACRK